MITVGTIVTRGPERDGSIYGTVLALSDASAPESCARVEWDGRRVPSWHPVATLHDTGVRVDA